MRLQRRFKHVLASAVLLVVLVGVLVCSLVISSDLPSRVYTPEQLAYLNYNLGRSISQVAPWWNIATAEGIDQSAILSYVRETRIRASLHARYEEQEGVSVTVYDLVFSGEYHLVYDGPMTTVQLFFPFPDNLETLQEVGLLVDGEEPPEVQYTTSGIHWETELGPGDERQLQISYQADGANSFAYGLYHGQRSDVNVVIEVVGLAGSTVPRTSLPATGQEATEKGEILVWEYRGLIVDRDVQLTLPTRLSFAQRIAALEDDFRVMVGLAPVLVALFLASLAAVFHQARLRLGLEGYLLAGCGMALFFPLFIFLSGIVDLVPAAVLALLLVGGLLLAFLSRVAGWHQVRCRVGLLLLIFLGLFSLGILTPWRGLMLTAGGLSLVGAFMLVYARRPQVLEAEATAACADDASEPDPDLGMEGGTPEPDLTATAAGPAAPHDDIAPEPPGFFCPFCAGPLADQYRFCPGCGHDTRQVRRCTACEARQFVPVDLDSAHCVRCGVELGLGLDSS